jgi:hypothetical protein
MSWAPSNSIGGLELHGRPGRQPSRLAGRGTAGTTGRSANPMPFPRLPQGDTISVMSRRLGALTHC